jgi:hypothetical protein
MRRSWRNDDITMCHPTMAALVLNVVDTDRTVGEGIRSIGKTLMMEGIRMMGNTGARARGPNQGRLQYRKQCALPWLHHRQCDRQPSSPPPYHKHHHAHQRSWRPLPHNLHRKI